MNKLEYGDTRGIDAWVERGDKLAGDLGLKTKLSRALIASDVINRGVSRARRDAHTVSKQLGGSPASGVDEKAWVTKYLTVMSEQRGPLPQTFVQRRVSEFQTLIDKGDWDLTTYKPADVRANQD